MLTAALEVEKDEDAEEGGAGDEDKDEEEEDAELVAEVPASVSSGFVLLRLRVATGLLPVVVWARFFSRARNSMLLAELFVDFIFRWMVSLVKTKQLLKWRYVFPNEENSRGRGRS